ncbi:MAG: methyl-accepting chemotaxis protein [Pseudomonadota bacterium]
MTAFFKTSLMMKFVILFLLVALIPIALVGYFSYSSAERALFSSGVEKLAGAGEDRKLDLMTYVRGCLDDALFLSFIPSVKFAFEVVESSRGAGKSGHGDEALNPMDLYDRTATQAGELLAAWQKVVASKKGYLDLLIVTTDGRTAYSIKKRRDLGTDLKVGEMKDSGLADAWAKVVKSRKPVLVDFGFYKPADTAAAFVAVPVQGQSGDLIGVLVIELGTEVVNSLFREARRLGRTAEAYLVGSDFLMRSDSRFESSTTILNKTVKTKGVESAFAGKGATFIAENYRGSQVLGAYVRAGIPEIKDIVADFDWVVVVEIDKSELVETATDLAWKIAGIAFAVGLLVLPVGLAASRTMSRPIIHLATQVKRVEEGDLTVAVDGYGRHDELGELEEAFQSMIQGLQDQIRRTTQGINVLSTSVSQISATAGELSVSTANSSTALAQTATTVEEVKQAARISRDQAGKVALDARESVRTSESGKNATEETIRRMMLIREQMGSIADTVVRLSEQTRSIEEIIGTVQDLADQSNLLSVNASIEAARAGDQGRGFAVVAQEIKALSDQSNHATQQVRVILDETRKWVSAVVMATEQGTKAVDAGVEQSVSAGESIRSLADGVTASSQAASIIHSSSEQQVVGLDQIAEAMRNIDQAMRSVSESASQLEQSARSLEELGGSLKEMVQRYRS